MGFGSRVADNLNRLGMTQAELARRVGLKTSTLGNYITGIREPGIEVIVQIAHALDVSTDQLLGARYDGTERHDGSFNHSFAGMAEDAPKMFDLPAPRSGGWSEGPEFTGVSAFVLRPEFDVTELVGKALFLLVDPSVQPQTDDVVYLEDRDGLATIGRFVRSEPNGWLSVLTHGRQLLDQRAPSSLTRFHPVTWWGRTPLPFLANSRRGASDTLEALSRAKEMLHSATEIINETIGEVHGNQDQ